MLQQTQVDTVIPYYDRWLERFPTLESVARTESDVLLKSWEGLGYYARCRNFHEACRLVWSDHGGAIPMEWGAFRSLPGVGDYTAAAVLSIAFKEPYPVLDGNVRRVMARLLCSNPRCSVCPVTHFCQSQRDGTVGDFPVKPKRKSRPHRTIVAGIIWRGAKFLIQKRPPDGLLGGLWEFPGGKVEKGESLSDALIREIEEETGLAVKAGKKAGAVDHAYTHFSITLHLYHCRPLNGATPRVDGQKRWISPDERSKFAFPRATHKLFEILDSRSWSAGA